ncbi:putative nuclease HARBI1 [Mercenaria mercenaria]|uniref:putative nuclease HARBI1 n=1 Tax=Mercenaria mercenaria TaxID=6596 RepID=UPI00234FA3F2|nr:putative nuclease HARBI1 [Mercenaria mercenaria]
MAALLHLYNCQGRRNDRLFRERIGLDQLRDFEVMSRYRLDRVSIEALIGLLADDLMKPTRRSCSISAEIQVLVTLRYLAKGSFYSEVADLHGVSRSSVCHAVESVVTAINDKLDTIRFPLEILNCTKYSFYNKCGLPNVIGAIDGTLIPIQAPAENEAAYVCRKGFHAINMQAVVDSNMRFLDIVARWPGSQHDSFIFNNCGLKDVLESADLGYLLGDSGYPLRSYLMTPILNPSSVAEVNFNNHHSSGRSVVEKAFGVLKSRFRCLHKSGGCLMLKPSKCCKVAEACVRLHNFCIDRQIPLNEDLAERDTSDDISVCQLPPSRSGSEKRSRLVRLFQ